ncbi:restriction endonuclease subunit S [Aeromonas sp. QDB66]|uniref:restriction endonuclease subunit S n=1 Tax=Aeromonas sp. QDB66 TaxID=2989824 RepID=UPI0022E3279F|nr:restriction endonuclease subunit S [Aeromonas sp. QDB66]
MVSDFFTTTIGEQLTLQRGFDITKKEQLAGNVPVVSSGGISSFHNVAKVTAPGVVLGRKGSLGTVYFLKEDYWPHDTTLWVKDFKGNNPRFVYYFFQGMASELKKMDVGAANPALNRNHVHPLMIEWPSKHIQDKIVEIASSLDDKILLNRQINQTLEQMAQALFKSWFVDFDPVVDNALDTGFFEQDLDLPDELLHRAGARKAVRTQDGFKPLPAATRQLFPVAFEPCAEPSLGLGGWVPQGWYTSTIGDEFIVKGGSTPSTANSDFWEGGDIHWTSPKDLSGNPDKVLLTTERKITSAGLDKITSGLLPPETVLMSSRAPVGYLAITKIPTAINQGYIAITKTKRLSQEFALYWLDANIDMVKSLSGGTTFAEISKKTFRTIPIIVPDQKTIDWASNIIRSNLDKISANAEECRELEKLRDYLLPKLISGELEVNS